MAMTFGWVESVGSACALLLAAAVGCSVETSSGGEERDVASTSQAICDFSYYAGVCQRRCTDGCTDGNVISACMSACIGGYCSQPSASSPFRTDSTGTLAQVLRSGSFEISDVRGLPNAVDSVVAFGFSAAARYGRAADFGGNCPGGTVRLFSSSLQSLGDSSLCVETSPTGNDSGLRSQATQTFLDIVANPNSANLGLPTLRDAIDAAAQLLLTGAVCRTAEDGGIAFCLRREGSVDVPRTIGVGQGLCPILPDAALHNACVNRGNQTPVGCGVIACIEPLSALGVAGCINAVRGNSVSPSRVLAASAFCPLIAKRDHLYTAPRLGGSVEICSTTDPRCTRSFVVQMLMADVRRQAPYVLDGPPSGGIARPRVTSPLPIDPSRLYYLGGYVELMGLSIPTNTSNPIRVAVPNDGSFIAAVNIADQDHLLEGTAESHIFQEGASIRSRVIGRGRNTRFALLNELVGPTALGQAQSELRSAVQAALQ